MTEASDDARTAAATEPSATEPTTTITTTPATSREERVSDTTTIAPEPGTEQDPPAEDPKADTTPKPDPRDRAIRQMAFDLRETRRQAAAAQAALDKLQPRDPKAPPTQADFDRQVQQRAEALVAQRETAAKSEAWIAAGNTDYADFTERCNALADMGAAENQAFMQTIGKLPGGHKVVAELAADPAEAARILKLAPIDLALELAGLSQRIAAKPATPKPTTQAPPPIRPLATAARAELNPDRMEPAEFQKWWNKKTRG